MEPRRGVWRVLVGCYQDFDFFSEKNGKMLEGLGQKRDVSQLNL